MKPQQATDLATEFAERWRNGLSAHLWEQDLLPLNFVYARRTYEQIKHAVRFPGQAPVEFHEAYRQIASQAPTSDPRFLCYDCLGSGWVDAEGHHSPFCEGGDCHCSAARPCNCTEGDKRRKSPLWQLATGRTTTDDERQAA